MILQAEETSRRDTVNLLILLSLAAVIGIYMILSTVLISQDGVFYIESAQKIFDSPTSSIQKLPPGFAFLIAGTHSLVSKFVSSDSLYVWIYSAQGLTLLCRLLALVPIYFTGKILVGAQKSFCSALIFIFLPYPAQACGEVLRDWPHILFLTAGFLFLLIGSNLVNKQWLLFGLAGFAAGIGFLIRHECCQLLLYGILWLTLKLFRKEPGQKISRIAGSLLILVFTFLIPSAFYINARGNLLLPEFKSLIKLFSSIPDVFFNRTVAATMPDQLNIASGLNPHVLGSFINIIEGVSENLAYVFVPFMILGLAAYFRKRVAIRSEKKFFVSAFILFNIAMLVLLDSSREYISKRHCLPLVFLLLLYVPEGLEIAAVWITHIVKWFKIDKKQLAAILLSACLISCLPKLLEPIGSEKEGYLHAATWLSSHSPQNAMIAVPDYRISFYAMREGVEYERKKKISRSDIPNSIKFIVLVSERNGQDIPKLYFEAQKRFSGLISKKNEQKIYVYKRL